jgi:putative hydrolase of the HAD superfamily
LSIPPSVRAIFFDAVGTLLHPHPPAPAAYAAAGRRHGSTLPLDEVRARFATAFARQEEHDRARGLVTNEAREVERWRAIVYEVLSDVRDPEACFAELYAHFADPAAWALDPQAEGVLRALAGRGYVLGIASNFDSRLRGLVAGLPALAPVRHLVISSEVGWRKPAPGFFEALCREAGREPGEVLLVGDDLDNDYRGARAFGLHALLLDDRRGGLAEPAAPSTGTAEGV